MNPGTSYKHYLSPEHNPLRNVTHKRNNEDLLHAKSTKNGIKLCKVTASSVHSMNFALDFFLVYK